MRRWLPLPPLLPLLLAPLACGEPDLSEPALDRPPESVLADPVAPAPAPHGTSVVALPPGDSACVASGPTWFVDQTVCAGLSSAAHVLPPSGMSVSYVTGQVWADFDGDTWLDALVTSWDGGNTRLFLGSANGTFTPRHDPALEGTPASGAVAADVDGDGRTDVFLAGRATDFLLLNNGDQLQRVPDGPSSPGLGFGASFADLDLDGLPELFVANYACPECTPSAEACAQTADALFVRGPGGWTDQSLAALGGRTVRCGLGFMGSFADFDQDGDLDLYVGNDKGLPGEDLPGTALLRNTYFRNEGPGCGAACFKEIARENGSDLRIDSMGLEIGDIDADGDLDLLASDTGPTRLLINDGTGVFTDETEARGLAQGAPPLGWGLALLDVDNDGDLDLFTAASGQDRMHENVDGAFVPVTELAVPSEPRVSYGLAAADYDRDGRVDLLVGDPGWGYRLLRNTRSVPHGWLGLRLVGLGVGGTDAIGARVWVTDTSGRTQLREVRSGISNGAGSDLGLHFGLGGHELVEVRVRWPDGLEEVLDPQVERWSVVTRHVTPADRSAP